MQAYIADKYFRFTKFLEKLLRRLFIVYSRMEAHRARKKFVRNKGESILNRTIKRTIKAYARERFGSAAFWPHLAHYAEIRGAFIKGFIPEDYFIYILEPKLNQKAYKNFGDQRTLDHRRFGDFAIEPLFMFISGTCYTPDCERLGESELKTFLAAYDDTIVVKQEFGWGGKQVRIIHSSEFKAEELKTNINYVIQPYIKQHQILMDLYPHSVNTFRITTFLKKDRSVEVLYAMLRFGVDGTKVDNLSSGGNCLFIDSSGNPSSTGYDELCIPVGEQHKNTGYPFADLKIPMFPGIIEKCKTAHLRFPYLRLIGWDVCINEAGEAKLIEWNTDKPTVSLEDAMFGPFFPDDSEFE